MKSSLFTDNNKYTGLFEMIVGFLTNCHTQYIWDRRICILFIQ